MVISVITVNYNNLNGLKRTVASVLEQAYPDIEYIVIDGDSTDGSKQYLEAIEDSVSYRISEPDTGIYSAMNKGIRVAKGEYLLFLNSGDHFYSPRALLSFGPHLGGSRPVDILYGNIAVISETEWIKTYPDKLSFSYFVKETLPHPATLIRRACFDKDMYDEELRIVSDWKFFMNGICRRKYSYRHIDTVISTFYLDGISSTDPGLVEKERRQVLTYDFSWELKMHKLKQKVRRKLRTVWQ